MSLPYRNTRLELPGLKGLDETTEMSKQIAILRETHEQIATFLNQELASASTSLNGTGGAKQNFRTTTANTIFASTDGTIAYDTTAGAVDALLPLAKSYPGMVVTVYKSTGANAATLTPSGADTIVGGGSATITTLVRYQSDAVNNNWIAL